MTTTPMSLEEAERLRRQEMINALLGAGGAAMETWAAHAENKANREQQQRLSRSATLQDLYEGDQAEDFLRERTALDATQLNPFAQLEADQSQAIRAALLRDITSVTGRFDSGTGRGWLSGGINLANLQRPDVQAFVSPEARLGARSEFDTIRAAVAPNVPIGTTVTSTGAPISAGRPRNGVPISGTAVPRPSATTFGLSATGTPLGSYAAYGPAGMEVAQRVSQFGQQRHSDLVNRRNVEREAIMRALDSDINGQKKSGGGFWKTLGRIASFAAPIVAAPFTGGTSLALIGAGAGAANAALSGGRPGAILAGAGMGALGAGASKAIAGQIPGLNRVGSFRPAAQSPSFTPLDPRPYSRIRFGGN